MIKKPCLRVAPLALAGLLSVEPFPLFGSPADEPEAGEMEELQEYVVEGISPSDSVNPLAHPVEAVYGWEGDLLTLPRSVSIIPERLMRDRQVDSVVEIIPHVPGAQAPSSYGNNTTPDIRGDIAEFYVNGQRRSGNEFGYDPSFNSVEAIQIVRGPATVSFGPGFYSGGYVNYVTKKADLDTEHSELSLRLGTWAPAYGSYFDSFVRFDHGVPLRRGELGMRISYEGQENDTFYHRSGGREDYQDLFLALKWNPGARLVIDFNSQYAWQAIPELLGVNRPYDGLIVDNQYLNGELSDPMQTAPDSFSIRTEITGRSDFDPRDSLLSTGDFSNANLFNAQVVSRLSLDSGWALVNRSFFEHVNRRRHHEFSYTEYVRQLTFESRSEWAREFSSASAGHKILAGFTVRYEETEAYMNYFSYYPYAYDISRGPPFRAEDTLGLFGRPGPGNRLFFGSEEGLPETSHSRFWHPAIFWQHEVSFNGDVQFLYGVRGNAYAVEVADPLPPEAVDTPWSDSGDFRSGDFNLSLTWRLREEVSLYGTFNRTHAVDASTGGGAIMLSSEGKIEEEDFTNRGELIEGGMRMNLRDNRLYLAASAFRQDRFRSELGGGRSGIRVHGFELESVFQPGERFYLLTNLAYLSGRYRDASPFVLGGADLNGLYTERIAPPADPAVVGADGQVVPSDYPISGLSKWTSNFGLSWQSERALGFRFWGSVRSPQPGNLLGQYTIPTQLELNSSVFWRRERWELSVNLLNLTDEPNWVHNGDEFGSNVYIARNLPFRMEAHFRISL